MQKSNEIFTISSEAINKIITTIPSSSSSSSSSSQHLPSYYFLAG